MILEGFWRALKGFVGLLRDLEGLDGSVWVLVGFGWFWRVVDRTNMISWAASGRLNRSGPLSRWGWDGESFLLRLKEKLRVYWERKLTTSLFPKSRCCLKVSKSAISDTGKFIFSGLSLSLDIKMFSCLVHFLCQTHPEEMSFQWFALLKCSCLYGF